MGLITPNWMDIAFREFGVSEIAGNAHNPRIIEYHAATTLKATQDEVAWCSSFVNWCMKQAGEQITGSAAARSWLTYGKAAKTLTFGGICIIPRPPIPESGHVGFLLTTDEKWMWWLNGNVGNRVTVSKFARELLLDCRVPMSYAG